MFSWLARSKRPPASAPPNDAAASQAASALRKQGNAHLAQGDLPSAERCYREAARLAPHDASNSINLGYALLEQGQDAAAREALEHALARDADSVDGLYLLASVDARQEHWDQALARLRRAVALRPDFAEAYNNMGSAQHAMGLVEEAIVSYHRALELRPAMAEALSNLGSALKDAGRLAEAQQCLRRALELEPGDLTVRGKLLFAMSFDPGVTPDQYGREAATWGQMATQRARPFTHWDTGALGGTQGPLRVGLVSGDLWDHPVGYFLESILRHLDSAQVQLFAYSTQPHEDALTQRIKPRMHAWRSVSGLADEAAAHLVHADKLHILLDLSGHTAHNRLPMFAWSPAPVQASWLGFFASTGVEQMDYFLADPASVPQANRTHFRESIWYLPETRLCFTPPGAPEDFPVSPLPALRNGWMTFGSFQAMAKLSDEVLALWGTVLQAVPQARLRIQNKALNGAVDRQVLAERLQRAGIAAGRTELLGLQPRKAYLQAHAEVDMLLDTFPYPGGTTTCEALWMGVPTVTLAGNTLLARQGASMLGCAGLPDWVAQDADSYVAIAKRHAEDLPALSQLRAGLRAQALASPLFDPARFARHFEEALHGMWAAKSR